MIVLKKLIPKFLKEKIKAEINKNYLFSGWNMQTNTCPPWKYINSTKNINTQINYFSEIQKEFENLIINKKFKSNQFKLNLLKKSKELMWRHYNLALSIKYVLRKKISNLSLCEVGVADGITAWFVLKVLEREKIKHDNFWLYDSWEEMKKDYLEVDEYNKIGNFKNNDINITKDNLFYFKDKKFIKGFIPKVFEIKENAPMSCDWLHIDLNSSNATLETLNFFESRLSKKGLIIFDDFGWPSYETTRITIEKWCLSRNGMLWPLPTGQAIYFNDN
jgi:hypothetical protein